MSEAKELLNLTTMQRFSHDHPLEFIEKQKNGGDEVYCSGCADPIEDSCYYCAECKFYLHKTCTDLPLNINHPLHQQHSLILLVKSPYRTRYCDLCYDWEGFFYHCSSCDFDLDVKCALSPQLIAGEFSELQHFSHEHPLIFVQTQNNRLKRVCCAACDEPTSGPIYSCIDCNYLLHTTCTDLPLNINNSLHQEHSLALQVKSPYPSGSIACDLCNAEEGFFYHCSSCQFDLDVKCALSSQLITGEFSKLQHFSHEHPFILVQTNRLERFSCAACNEPPSGPVYCCMGCTIYLHKRCAELPPEITHPSHRKHPLVLLANPPLHQERCSCHLCRKPGNGFYYHCSFCEFGIEIKHIVSSQSENGIHEHPFILLSRAMPFVCDACGTDGDCSPYLCTTCNLVVHKECISLPRMIKIPRHADPISHIYFLPEKEYKQRFCKICYDEVKTEYGSYYCSDCDYIVHVNCMREKDWLKFEVKGVLTKETMGLVPNDHNSSVDLSATEIKHFCHDHNLMLSEEMIGDRYCDGCMLTISGPFYFCKQCDFFLHKSCAKLPMKTHFWFSTSQYLHQEYSVFKCDHCKSLVSGFSYMSERRTTVCCLRCCQIPDYLAHDGHEHPIFFDAKYEGNCTACGGIPYFGFRCKSGDFALDIPCILLPQTSRHKNHKHPLKRTYHEGSDPSQYYCDICEEERDPAYWFYSCADCSFTAHTECALGQYPFIQEGVTVKSDNIPHPLATVRKTYYYPRCTECREPCLDLALECTDPECNYTIHWDCALDSLLYFSTAYGKIQRVAV